MRNSLSTHIWIFSVGRGSAAFVRTGLNQGFILDMGGGEIFDPVHFVSEKIVPNLNLYSGRRIAQVVLSHPHADHISQCASLLDKPLSPALITCPNDKSDDWMDRIDWSRLGAEDPLKQELIGFYTSLYSSRSLPLQTICFEGDRSIPNLEYGIYYLRPGVCEELHPSNDNDYGNALSIMFYLKHGRHSILFAGDMTPEGMSHVLNERYGTEKRYSVLNRSFTEQHPDWHNSTVDQPSLRSLLRCHGLSVLVVPHHGLESCYSEDLFPAMLGGKPSLNVISERRKPKEGQGRCHPCYQSEAGASGLTVAVEGDSQVRRSVTTINGHHILIVFSGNGAPRVHADRDPARLLKYAV